jgi:hypothetical protein
MEERVKGSIIPIIIKTQGRMSGDASSSSTFCTMGNMMHKSSAVRRRKITAKSSNNDNNRRDAYIPVIIPDETTHGDGSGSESDEIYRHHDHDNIGNDMDHSHDHNIPMMMSQGTIMFMDGFRSTLFPSSQTSSPPPPCLNLFYPSWTLHTPSRFVFAMIVITLMGILVEVCGVWRVKCLRRGRNCRREDRLKRIQSLREDQQQQHLIGMQGRQIEFRRQSQLHHEACDVSDVSLQPISVAPTTTATAPGSLLCPAVIRRMWRTIAPEFVRTMLAKICCCCFALRTKNDGMRAVKRYDVIAASLHALRAWLGYLLMLAVMTYAIEFLASAVIGMVLGRYLFVDMGGGEDELGAIGAGGKQNNGIVGVDTMVNDGVWGGGDPCCGIDDTEDDFHDAHEVMIGPRLTDICEPLLSPSMENNSRVIRRGVGGQQIESIA